MSEGCGCRLSAEEAAILWQSGSFWPDSVLDKDTFMELLTNVLSLEFPPISEWEKQLVASGAQCDDGKVDVRRFVAASSVSTTPTAPNTIVMPEVGLQPLAPTSSTVSQTAAPQEDASEISRMSAMTTTSGDVQLLLPTIEVTAGAVVSAAPE
eukprot:2138748-Amphidinium_carterae.1